MNNGHKTKHIIRRYSTGSLSKRRAIRSFAEKFGLIYFGMVDQHKDEHSTVRGFSASLSHKDDNYCTGTVDGYDINLVDRTDFIKTSERSISHNWIILELALHEEFDWPHMFLKAKDENSKAYQPFFALHGNYSEVSFDNLGYGSNEFSSRFSLYSNPSFGLWIEEKFGPNLVKALAAHLWPLSVEINGNKIYVYFSGQKIKLKDLELTTKKAIWLASSLDQMALEISEN